MPGHTTSSRQWKQDTDRYKESPHYMYQLKLLGVQRHNELTLVLGLGELWHLAHYEDRPCLWQHEIFRCQIQQNHYIYGSCMFNDITGNVSRSFFLRTWHLACLVFNLAMQAFDHFFYFQTTYCRSRCLRCTFTWENKNVWHIPRIYISSYQVKFI